MSDKSRPIVIRDDKDITVCRVEDKADWAVEMLRLYRPEVLAQDPDD